MVKAFVLRKTSFGESDLIVQFLLETGKVISGFAGGGRRSKKRFSHQFDITGVYEVEWHRAIEEKKLTRLHRCDLLNHDSELSQNLEALCRWAIVLEWISLDAEHEFDFAEIYRLR